MSGRTVGRADHTHLKTHSRATRPLCFRYHGIAHATNDRALGATSQMERRERLKRLIAQRDGEVDLDLPTTDQLMVEEVAVQKVRTAGYQEGCCLDKAGYAACTVMSRPAAPRCCALGAVRRLQHSCCLRALP